MTRFLITFLCAAHSLALCALAQESDIRRYDASAEPQGQFEIYQKKDPIFPHTLRRKGVEEGNATFVLHVNQFGELVDFLPLEASHVAFAEAVERVLPDWDFSVPFIDGEPSSIASSLTVKFKRGGTVVYETSGIHIPNFFRDFQQDNTAYRIYAIWELDSVPEPLDIQKPEFHVDLLEQRELVNAVFEFYIDTEGHVRIPTLREADDKIDERLLIIAQDALLQWRFKTPTVDGKPVVARAAQPFRFRNKDRVGVVE